MDQESNNFFFIDSHCHLTLLKESPRDVISKCRNLSVKRILNVGFDLLSSSQSIELAKIFPSVDASIGIHPHYAEGSIVTTLEWMEKEIQAENCIAIGEIGLDTIRSKTNQASQMEWFEAQLSLAQKYKLPVIIHNREADEDIESTLLKFKDVKGVLHCFSSGIDFANKMLSEGWFLSFSGNITYPKNEIMRNIIKQIPLQQLLLETDAPYLTPLPYRGKQENSPVLMPDIYDFVSKVRKENLVEISEQIARNYFLLFKKPDGLNE